MLRTLVVLLALLASRSADAALTAVTGFGSNPGALSMYEYVPAGLPAGRPVVVVMHGCTQTAAAMEAAGWNALADQYKFTVVYPEQNTANNPVRCFNWAGEYGDTANLVRGQGENLSIIQMVDKAIASHGADSSRVYLVGFSAGGAFVPVMLSTYPERFAGAAIMSGVPYRCATSVNGAYSCQSPGVTKTAAAWGDLVRGSHAGPYPRVQIWHGASDSIVVPANAAELIKQWTNAHGVDDTADDTETIGAATRTAYKAANGTVVVEAYRITGMGHATATGTDPAGPCTATTGAYFENKGICSTRRAADFFGLLGTVGGGSGGGGGGGGGTDTINPSVAIQTPANGDTVSGTVTVVVAASDETAMGGVTLQVDGVAVGAADTEAPYQFSWDASAAGAGAHQLLAIARDATGNSATATAMVTVPGAGGGSGSGSGSGSEPDDEAGTQELPGCALDAGGGGAGFGTLALGVAILLGLCRRR
ncbi:MAG: PHB depolymerase family esterase [Myxococcales bacterium]|nr:PHB depolymerase family esterase [Myxococcales bacterium]